ncbi:MAG: biotin-dependent carboxyltransferase [Thermococci archaeon]|nr:biotin-dependent carboxyltransferase [Thermococci archaeon]
MIELLRVPSLVTVQDSGRRGYRRLGVPVSGYMDDYSARIVNYLVGNSGSAPLMEFLLSGPTLKFHSSAVFAVAGDAEVRLNGVPVEPWTSHWAKRGDVLEVGTLRTGVYGYVAFAGGLRCERLLGSCSACPRAGLGRHLMEGDRLPLGAAVLTGRDGRRLPEELRPDYSRGTTEVRVIPGPDTDHFTDRGMETFFGETYTVTPESDRMGYRLEGRAVEHSGKGAGIVTGPLVPGSIQVPADGRPIIMMRDAQTTGGYARIGTVAGPDLRLVAQTRPGRALRFRRVDAESAVEAVRGYRKLLEALQRALGKNGAVYRVRTGGRTFIALTYP